MPRPRFGLNILADTFTLAAAGSENVDVDLTDSFYPQILVIVTYQATASTTGVDCTIYPGFYEDADTILYSDNGDSVSEMQDPTGSVGTPQTKKTAFSVNAEQYPRRIRLRFTNNDATNACTIKVIGDW